MSAGAGSAGRCFVGAAERGGRRLGVVLLLASPAEVVVGPIAGQKVSYDPQKDFAPITLVAGVPNVMIVNTEKAKALQAALAQDAGAPVEVTAVVPG